MIDEKHERVLAIWPQSGVTFPDPEPRGPKAPRKMTLSIVSYPPAIDMVEDVYRNHESIGLLAKRRADGPVQGPQDLFSIGTIAGIENFTRMDDGKAAVIMRGQARFRLLEVVQVRPYPRAQVELLEGRSPADGARLEVLTASIRKLCGQMMELKPELSAIKKLIDAITEPGLLADVIAPDMGFSLEETQSLLETVDLEPRLSQLVALLTHRVATLGAERLH